MNKNSISYLVLALLLGLGHENESYRFGSELLKNKHEAFFHYSLFLLIYYFHSTLSPNEVFDMFEGGI